MAEPRSEKLNIVVAAGRVDLEQIRAVAPDQLNVVDVLGDLYAGLVEEWPEQVLKQRLADPPPPSHTPEETASILRAADVFVFGMPYPMSIAAEAQRARWIHFVNASPNYLRRSPWWRGPALLTTTRGQSNPLPIAETAFAAALMFARRLDLAARNTTAAFDIDSRPRMTLFENKTIGIVGLGGIGSHLARLAKAVGMRVLASRHSAQRRQTNVDGVDELFPAASLMEMLPHCDFVALCAYWTEETERMMAAPQFAAMKPGAFLLNVARGELTDESDLIAALHSGQLAGAYVDTWRDETEKPPRPDLLTAPNLVLTPHISIRTDGGSPPGGVRLFCENLKRYLDGEALINVIDWDRGY